MEWDKVLISIIIGYFFGTISFSAIWAKIYNVNLGEIGSRNIGATNLSRAIGWSKTLFPAIADGVKCFMAMVILQFLLQYKNEYLLWGMIFTAIGHIWPFWNKFRGGKGVAVSIGYIFATVSLWYVFIAVTTFVYISKKWKIMTYASMAFLTMLFIGVVFFPGNIFAKWDISVWPHTLILILIVVFKHRQNFIRLWRKKELKN